MLNSYIDGPHSKLVKLLIKLFRNIEYAITHFKMIRCSMLLKTFKLNLIYCDNIYMSGV